MYAHRPFLITELVYTVIPSAEYVEKYHVGWNCFDDNKKAVELVLEHALHPNKLSLLDLNFKLIPIIYDACCLANKIIYDAATSI